MNKKENYTKQKGNIEMFQIPQDLVMQSTKEMTTMWLLFMKDEENKKKWKIRTKSHKIL